MGTRGVGNAVATVLGMTNANRDLRSLSRVGMLIGAVLLVLGLVRLASVPPEPASPDSSGFMEGHISIDEVGRRNDAWFDASVERGNAQFIAFALLGFGAVAFLGGLGLTRRARSIGYQLQAEHAAAITRGVRVGLTPPASGGREDRLAELIGLHQRGLISDTELAAKRQEILASL